MIRWGRWTRGLAVVAVATVGVVPLAGATPAGAATSKNLVKNPGAEAGPGGTGEVVAVPDWTESTGATFTAVRYDAGGGFPDPSSPGPKKRGANFFAGGPGDASNTIVATQTIKLKKYATAIAGGNVGFVFSGYFGGYSFQNDQASAELDFKDKHGNLLDSYPLGPVDANTRNNVTGMLLRTTNSTVSAKAKTAVIQLVLVRTDGSYNDAYADNLSLILTGV